MTLLSPHNTGNESNHGLQISLVNDELFRVMNDTDTLGFIYRAGSVFVSLRGADVAQAVEVGQSLTLDRAIDYVQHAA